MMQPLAGKRNRTPGGLGLLMALLWGGCAPTGDLQLSFVRPASPDPFAGVERIELWAYGPDGRRALGRWRWDQGAFRLRDRLPADTQRVVAYGLSADGSRLSSGVSPPLELGARLGAITVFFSRIGALSRLNRRLPALNGPRLVATPEGALLIDAVDPEAPCVPSRSWRLGGAEARVRPGPTLPQGRAGDFSALGLPGGGAVLLGGQLGCGPPGLLHLGADGQPHLRDPEPPLPPEALLLPHAPEQLLVVGGRAQGQATAAVQTLSLRPPELSLQGQLGQPRAGARGVIGFQDRALIVGGQATGEARSDARLYLPNAGRVEGPLLPTGAPRRRPAVVLSPAGAAWVAGGETIGGQGSRQLRQLLFQRDPQTEPLATLPQPLRAARGLILAGGGALFLPEGAGPAAWLQPLPLTVASVTLPEPLLGAPLPDGTAILVGRSGQLYSFNPGPAWLDGPGLRGGPLAGEGASGLIPRRPQAWSLAADGGWVGTSSVATLRPGWDDWLRVGDRDWGDFSWEVELELDGRARVFLPFAYTSAGSYAVRLSSRSWIQRLDATGSARGVDCPTGETPALGRPGRVRLRLSRRAGVLNLDVGADGSVELRCWLPEADRGGLGLGLSGGTVGLHYSRLRQR